MGTRSKYRQRHEKQTGAVLLRCPKCDRLTASDGKGKVLPHKTVIRHRVSGWARSEGAECK